jgi:hypothetical protein
MTPEQCAVLEQKARNCRDNAKAEMLVVEAFMPEYRKGLAGHPEASKQTHDRSMEIYDFAIRGDHRARNFLRDAELFEAAAALGRSSLSPPQSGTPGGQP